MYTIHCDLNFYKSPKTLTGVIDFLKVGRGLRAISSFLSSGLGLLFRDILVGVAIGSF